MERLYVRISRRCYFHVDSIFIYSPAYYPALYATFPVSIAFYSKSMVLDTFVFI